MPIEDTLNPADLFLRARILEEQRDFAGSKTVFAKAMQGIYTADYQRCADEQIGFIAKKVKKTTSPIVDIACGRGYLLERLIQESNGPVVGTDFSPVVLRRNRWWFEQAGLYTTDLAC